MGAAPTEAISIELNTPDGAKFVSAGSGVLAANAGTAHRVVSVRMAAANVARRGASTFSHSLFAGFVDWLEQVIQNTLFPR